MTENSNGTRRKRKTKETGTGNTNATSKLATIQSQMDGNKNATSKPGAKMTDLEEQRKPRRKLRPGQYLAIITSTAMRLSPYELEQRMNNGSFPFNESIPRRRKRYSKGKINPYGYEIEDLEDDFDNEGYPIYYDMEGD